MEQYYLGGYYLIKLNPIGFGDDLNKIVWTCSGCINYLAFGSWCLSWMDDKLDKKEKVALQLSDENIAEIQQWSDNKFEGLINGFSSLEMAFRFKDLFFKSRDDIEILSINFPVEDMKLLIDEFGEGKNTREFNYNNGNFGLRKNLLIKNKEQDNSKEEFLGFDLIGVECDGSFHSFYCSNITNAIIDKFNIIPNALGLFDKIEDPDKVRKYLNDPKSGLEPIPYYIVKIKRVRHSLHRQQGRY